MGKKSTLGFTRFVAAILAVMIITGPTAAQGVKNFTVIWSIYAGWMPWDYAQTSGILAKHAKANGVSITLKRMDYVPSVEAYVSDKNVAAVVMTNMEALDMPAAAGIDSTSLIMGDYSNGNDAVQARGIADLNGLRGQKVYLAEGSVSHYLLNRCLEKKSKITERDLTIVNSGEADLVTAVKTQREVRATVTWNPFVMQVAQVNGVRNLCDSSEIPGEIMDLMVVKTDVLKANPGLGRALVFTWYEVLGRMARRGDPQALEALTAMAKASDADANKSVGTKLAEFQQQLTTTAMFYTPQSAVDFTENAEIKQKMELVRQFCFSHGLLGKGVKSVDVVGIQYPDGSVQGNPKNIKLRFDSSYMKAAIK